MTTNLQAFLRAGGELSDLAGDPWHVKTSRHRDIPSLVLFKYDQINSSLGDPLVRECRGIILDEANDWACVSRSFDKFFNHGEPHAASIDWSTATVQEKIDGSLCSLYWYGDRWHVATTGTADASGDVNGSGIRFADLFWQTFRSSLAEPDAEWRGWTFLFELTSPANRVVVRHERASLTLLGARRATDGRWIAPEDAAIGIPGNPSVVRSFPLQSMDDVLATFAAMNPLAQEGYVIVDAGFNRVKVKHPGYVAIHHAKDGVSPRSLLEIALKGEVSEVIVAFPELQADLDTIKARLTVLCEHVDTDYQRMPATTVQREFALAATQTEWPAALFAIRAGKAANARSFFAGVPADRLVRALGLKDVAPTQEAA